MKKIKLNGVDEYVYKETLDNKLTIYLYKKKDFTQKFAYFQTRYGSINNNFIPINKTELTKYPLGIAHFLEHKLFESSDDSSVFEKLENLGAYVNAATSYEYTYYYFQTVNNFDKCLNILIDFVQKPCFTDENVEKEKGIIAQEIDMCNDDADRHMFQKLISNSLQKSLFKYDIAGTKSDINKITKDDLYDCYNTFYNPANMFMVIVGDIDIKKTINLIKKNQEKKHFDKQKEIVQKSVIEPLEVSKKYEELEHNVKFNKYGYSYKMVYDLKEGRDLYIFNLYVDIYLKLLFGPVTGFNNKLLKEGIINSYLTIDYDILINDNLTLLIYFVSDIKNKSKFEKELKNKFNNEINLKKEFELIKKNYLAGYVKRFESMGSIANLIRSNVAKYNDVLNDTSNILQSLNFNDFKKFIKELKFDNYCEVLFKPKGR